jgi:hypothetical protein
MKINSFSLALLILGPIVVLAAIGHGEVAKYLGSGCVLALMLGLFARPVAAFAVVLPLVYAAAALTAGSTDAAVALIVAIAAAVGAAGSLGLQRGLVALLAAVLLGSFEPAAAGVVLRRSAYMLAGITYGFVLGVTLLRSITLSGLPVRPQATLGYALLLAVMALVAWFAARLGGLANAWWLPLAVVAVSEPVAPRSAWYSLLRAAIALGATLVLVSVVSMIADPTVRTIVLTVLLLAAIWQGVQHPTLLALLLTPVLILLSSLHVTDAALAARLPATLAACLPIFAATCLGHWALWTLRPEPGRVAI